MAAWLFAIVRGDVEPAVAGRLDDDKQPAGSGDDVAAGRAEDDHQLVPTAKEAATKITQVKCTEVCTILLCQPAMDHFYFSC